MKPTDTYTVTVELEDASRPDRGRIVRLRSDCTGTASDLIVRMHDKDRADQLARTISEAINHEDEVQARAAVLEAFMRSTP